MSNYTDTSGWLGKRDSNIDWDAVYERELPRLYNFFLYQTGDVQTAQDLTAATFEQAWKSRRRYRRERAQVQTWLMGIARNVASKHFRRHRAVEELDATIPDAAADSLPDTVQHNAEKARLRQLLHRLPHREREVIALKYGAGMTNRAIAALTGLSESNVGTIVQRTVQRLRREWGLDNE